MYEFIAIHNVVIYVPSISTVRVYRDWLGRPHLLLTYSVKKSIRFRFQNREECDEALTLVKRAMVK